MRFRRLVESRPSGKASAASVADWQSKVFYDCDAPSDEKQKGRPCLTLSDGPCMKKQRSILKEAVKAIENVVTDQELEKAKALKIVVDER